MKQMRKIIMVLFMILVCCSCSIGQLTGDVGLKGNPVASPSAIFNTGAHSYPVGEYGAHMPTYRVFICNSMSACGIYDPGHASSGAIPGIVGASRVMTGANVYHRPLSYRPLNTS
jgi:hypothetical protein